MKITHTTTILRNTFSCGVKKLLRTIPTAKRPVPLEMAAADTPPFQMRQCANPLITWRLMGRQWILVEKKEDASGPKESPGNTEIGIGLGIPSPPPPTFL